MTKTAQDFSMVAGADRVLRFTVRDPVTGLVVNLTSYTAEWRAWNKRDETHKLEVAGVVEAPASAGIVTVTIDAAALTNADVGRWVHQLWLTDATLNVDCAAEGTFTVREAIPT